MKAILLALFVALLMVGCGGETQKEAVQEEAKDDPGVPMAIPCMACGKPVSKKTEKCLQCGHPTPESVVAYKKTVELERRLAEIKAEQKRKRAEEERKRHEEIDKEFSKWEANPKPYGGPEVLAKIKEAKKSDAFMLDLKHSIIRTYTQITDLTPLAGLPKLRTLLLNGNQITDLTPLKGLTELTWLDLSLNPIPADQIEMIKKALPKCRISFKAF